MLKKLRWRFIGVAMLSFTVVVLTLLLMVNLWNYENITKQQDHMLESLSSKREGSKPPIRPKESGFHDPLDSFSPEVLHMMRFFSVSYDNQGNVSEINQEFIASISKEDAVAYAENVLKKAKTRGYLEGYRYLVTKSVNGCTIFFLNSERELQITQSLLLITGLVALCCLIAVFLLVFALSNRAITPYIRNLEAQKRFITDASHELKTPITAISTSADVLSLEDADNEWIQNIQLQCGKTSKLISDLVTLSRLDEIQPFTDKTDFSLSDALWEVSEPFASLSKVSGKKFTQQIEDNLIMNGNCASISQMISILLDNALKYSDDQGTIQLDAHKFGRKIEIVVNNTCPYWDTKNINRIFDRFYRYDSARSNRDSHGIGLSIAKSIVENHGGTIKARSQGGTNLTITVRL